MDFQEQQMTLKERIGFAFICAGVAVAFMFCMSIAIEQDNKELESVKQDGFSAGVNGVPVLACPYDSGHSRHSWLSGYADGVISQKKTAEAAQ